MATGIQATFGRRRAPNAAARLAARFDGQELARAAFYGLLAGTLTVIGFDLKDIHDGWRAMRHEARIVHVEPVRDEPRRQGERPATRFAPAASPPQQARFVLKPGGVLAVEGSIEQGAARRFEAVLADAGSRVTTVSLDSPGGSLDDAMAMARTVRIRGLATKVPKGALCASSCPLLLAGGTVRSVGEGAQVGLHQFYAPRGTASAPAQAMADAQAIVARISRHLAEMGVDPALWLHAFETPPRSLYHLSPKEMADYRLVTTGQAVPTQ